MGPSSEAVPASGPASPGSAARIPLAVKLVYTAFIAVLVPYYLHSYGPTNFLYFCDVALLLTLAGVWLENSLLASMSAVGILLPQMLWIADFLCAVVGIQLTGMTAYMFRSTLSLFARGLSFFHFWLPLFLLWMLGRLGYDRRGLLAWTLLAWGLMFVCFFFMPAPPPPEDNPNLPVNINYVYGLSDKEPQSWLPAWQYFSLLLAALPLGMLLPAHLILRKVFAPANK